MKGWDHNTFGPVMDAPEPDPAMDAPFHCTWCGRDCTREDVAEVRDEDGDTGLMCPWCREIVWDEEGA
jgi:hypothetical protein